MAAFLRLLTVPAYAASQGVAYIEAPKRGGVDRLCFVYEPTAGRSVLGAQISP